MGRVRGAARPAARHADDGLRPGGHHQAVAGGAASGGLGGWRVLQAGGSGEAKFKSNAYCK